MRLAAAVLVSIATLSMALAGCDKPAGNAVVSAEPPLKPNGRLKPRRPDAPAERQAYDAARRLPEGVTALPLDTYPRLEARMAAMPRYSTKAGRAVNKTGAKAYAPPWQSLGPDNVAGRTRTLLFDPRDPQRMLAGGVSGGVFESRNGGTSWTPLAANAVNLNIGALAFDPAEPGTIYAGTGELYRNNGQPYASMWGRGILRSRDDGQSFQQLLATATDDFRYVSDIVVSTHDHRRLYAATNTGIWRSDDAGATFTQVLRPVDAQGRLRYEGCNDLELLPHASRDVLLAACSSRSTDDRYYLPGTVLPPACTGPCPASIFRNDDASGTGAWTTVVTEPGMGRTTLARARSNADIVYAISASIVAGPDRTGDSQGDYPNGLHAVWRSDDGGRTFEARVRNTSTDRLSTYLLSYADSFDSVACGYGPPAPYSAGWYNQAIAVDPTNAEVVWVAGMEHYRSDDGGRTFGKASYWDRHNFDRYGVHADQHFLVFHPQYDGAGNKRLYTTNDGGIAVTDDATAPVTRGNTAACIPQTNSVSWRDLTRGLSNTQYYTGTVTRDGSRYMGGLQDNGTLINASNGGSREWFHIFGGDGASVAFDPTNPSTLYVSYQYVNIHRSADGGVSFVRATNGLDDVPVFIMPFVLDTTSPSRLYAGASRVWRTDNQGRGWYPVSASFGFAYADKVSAIAVSPVNADHMVAGNRRGIRYQRQATDAGATTAWLSVSPREGWVSSLTWDPMDADRAYATYSTFGGAHVWRTTDGGANWQAIDGSGDGALPDVPVHALAIDPGNRERLFIGTDAGVFTSIDGGAHWAAEVTGFGNAIVEALQVAPGNGQQAPLLYAFTYGRGAWRVPLSTLGGGEAYRIGDDTSGTFYDPQQAGHGWVVHATTLDGVTGVLAAWYVFQGGQQRWLIGNGVADGNRARIPLFITRGGDFPPAFRAGDVVQEPWGEVELTFDDRDGGSARWTSTYAGFGNGEMPLVRLTRPAAGDGASPTGQLAACHSGVYFDPANGGHGVQLEIDGEPGARQAVLAWYVYLDGAQRWVIGTGPVVGDTATLAMSIARGGQFPPAFDPANVTTEPWGTLRVRAVDGDTLAMDWTSAYAGFNDGSLSLRRLSSLLGRGCD